MATVVRLFLLYGDGRIEREYRGGAFSAFSDKFLFHDEASVEFRAGADDADEEDGDRYWRQDEAEHAEQYQVGGGQVCTDVLCVTWNHSKYKY